MSAEKSEKLKIVGMHCATCVNTVSRAISKVNGVEGVTVNLATGFAEISGSFKLNEVIEAVKKAGYDVETRDIRAYLKANPEDSRKIMQELSEVPGVISAEFNPSTNILNVMINPTVIDQKSVLERLKDYSPTIIDEKKKGTSFVKKELNSMLYSLIAGAILAVFVLYFQYSGRDFFAFLFSIPVMAYSGRRYIAGAFRALKNRTADIQHV